MLARPTGFGFGLLKAFFREIQIQRTRDTALYLIILLTYCQIKYTSKKPLFTGFFELFFMGKEGFGDYIAR